MWIVFGGYTRVLLMEINTHTHTQFWYHSDSFSGFEYTLILDHG